MTRPRLILVNGMPGTGKSTLARCFLDDHPGALCVELDLLRTWIGGDRAHHEEAARHLAHALTRAHLESGFDVVIPLLVVRVEHVEQLEHIAGAGGAELIEVVLHGNVVEPRIPDSSVEHLVEHAHGLADVVGARTRTHRLVTRIGDPDHAYHQLLDVLDPDVPA